jgi:hypothetical protein
MFHVQRWRGSRSYKLVPAFACLKQPFFVAGIRQARADFTRDSL